MSWMTALRVWVIALGLIVFALEPRASVLGNERAVASAVASSLCQGTGGKCAKLLADVTADWIIDVLANESGGNMRARNSFEMLFSNPGAIADDVERLALFEAALSDPEFAGDLAQRLDAKAIDEIISLHDLARPAVSEALREFGAELAFSIITGVVTESLARPTALRTGLMFTVSGQGKRSKPARRSPSTSCARCRHLTQAGGRGRSPALSRHWRRRSRAG